MGLKQLHAGFRSAPRAGSFEEHRFGAARSSPWMTESGDGPGDPGDPRSPTPWGIAPRDCDSGRPRLIRSNLDVLGWEEVLYPCSHCLLKSK